MKSFKSFTLFLVLALMLSSCILLSLNPFYTKDLLYFEQKFIGHWEDNDNGFWEVETPFDENELEFSDFKLTDWELYDYFSNTYIVQYLKDSIETSFVAWPFKIDDQLFLDFTPYLGSNVKNNKLYEMHLVQTHSLAKLDIHSNDSISIKWFDSNKLHDFLRNNKIKIKHEEVGYDHTTMLTASSQELVKFIKKYMYSKDENKWDTRTEFSLKRGDKKIKSIND